MSQQAYGEVLSTSTMSARIRTAHLEADRRLLTDLLSQNLSPAAAGRRFDWLYFENPHGQARAWVATEDGTGRGIGAAAAFPRRLVVGGEVRLGFVLGDFCIDPHHRSLGLALQLQRACLDQLGSVPPSIAYDFPSDRMMAIYRRMQISPNAQMVRWAKPLRADRKMGDLIKYPSLAKLFAYPFNHLMKWQDFSSSSTGRYTITNHEGMCGEEFTKLALSIGSRYGSCVERPAEYLNWRYMHHPIVHYELLSARDGGELKGYVVFSHTGDDAKIVDLFGFSDTSMWTALMARVVALLRDRGVITLSMPAPAANPWSGLLEKWGFRPRENSPLVVCESQAGMEPGQGLPEPWFLMDGDRES